MNSDIETQVVDAFVIADLRERYRDGLASPKRRAKILDRLNHHRDDFDATYRRELSAAEQKTIALETLLRVHGAPSECYIISSAEALDGKMLPLAKALQSVIGSQQGTVISCIPGRLAFYEGEDPKTRVLLVRGAG